MRFITNVVTAVCLFAIVAVEYVRPFLADWYYRDSFRTLALECDQAMHDEAALRPGTAGGAKDPGLVVSGLVGLSVCHQYDLVRKKMLVAGVSEERLALIGLESLEHEQIPVSRMVLPHRMERF